jgi:hypothetical protein
MGVSYMKNLFTSSPVSPLHFFCDKFQTGTEIFVISSQTPFISVLLLTRQNKAAV